MPLSAGHPTLITDLKNAYEAARADGEAADADATIIIGDLADAVGDAIHTYMETALVITVGSPGIIPMAPPQFTTMPSGVYSSPGPTTATGEITFPGGDVQTLKGDIEDAYLNAKAAGEPSNAKADDIIGTLANDMMTAIHTFALTAEVETDVTLTGGAVVAGTIVGTSVVVGSSLPGTGEGEGFLS